MKKDIEIRNGKGIVQLKWNGSLSSLSFEKPLSLHWFDCMGSLGKFFAILPYNKTYRDEIQKRVSQKINSGQILEEKDLEFLVDFLSVFENSTYEISYEQDYKYEVDESWSWEIAKNTRDVLTNPLLFNQIDSVTSENISDIYTVTDTFYDGNNETLLFSQPIEIIDEKRVKHYEELIKKGLKPVAIIYYGMLEQSGTYDDNSKWISTEWSGLYIIDGHHKLLAYKNLEITPTLIRIVKRYNSKSDFNLAKQDFDSEIRNQLYKPQIKHINENCNLNNDT